MTGGMKHLLTRLQPLQGKRTAFLIAELGQPTKREAIPGQEGWSLWQWHEGGMVISAAVYDDVAHKVIAAGTMGGQDATTQTDDTGQGQPG